MPLDNRETESLRLSLEHLFKHLEFREALFQRTSSISNLEILSWKLQFEMLFEQAKCLITVVPQEFLERGHGDSPAERLLRLQSLH